LLAGARVVFARSRVLYLDVEEDGTRCDADRSRFGDVAWPFDGPRASGAGLVSWSGMGRPGGGGAALSAMMRELPAFIGGGGAAR
jgi:hypothetical protein